jgi:hypothetical protein
LANFTLGFWLLFDSFSFVFKGIRGTFFGCILVYLLIDDFFGGYVGKIFGFAYSLCGNDTHAVLFGVKELLIHLEYRQKGHLCVLWNN